MDWSEPEMVTEAPLGRESSMAWRWESDRELARYASMPVLVGLCLEEGLDDGLLGGPPKAAPVRKGAAAARR